MQALYAENGVNVELELALFEANHGDAGKGGRTGAPRILEQPNVKAADALAWALYRAGQFDEAARYSARNRGGWERRIPHMRSTPG